MTTIKYLTQSEKEELFQVIKMDSSLHAIRNRAIFYLAEYCALRVSEVGMLEQADYIPEYSHIYCRREKGSISNTIRIIDTEVLSALNDYLFIRDKKYPDSKYLFVSQMGNPISRKTLDHIMKTYCKNTSIPTGKRHFHVLKHTRAVELGNNDLDLKEIQWWLGHKNIENTQIYMQFTTTQQNALYKKLKGHSYGKAKNKRSV